MAMFLKLSMMVIKNIGLAPCQTTIKILSRLGFESTRDFQEAFLMKHLRVHLAPVSATIL
jgi:hypothetical protein